ARVVEPRRHRAGAERLAVGKARDADRAVEAEALVERGRVMERGAVPQAPAERRPEAERLAGALARGEAVVALVGRAEARVALLDVGQLAVQQPAVALERVDGGVEAGPQPGRRLRRIVAGGAARPGQDARQPGEQDGAPQYRHTGRHP